MEDLFLLPKSAKIAKNQGSKYYFTNQPCKRGHICARTTSTKCCVVCRKEFELKNVQSRKEYLKKYRKNPVNLAKEKDKKLQKLNWTLKLYNQIYQDQEGRCAICGTFQEVLCADHCHKSNKPRKLLCQKCNTGLGCFDDKIDTLQKAMEYLFSF